ncbi:MAG: dihydrolipoyl dehydrogenase [Leptospirales bacterium]|nr:dihydrolipoyl dehydrogenase [Leptospirales bacterium]
MAERTQLVVIGGGPGGYAAAFLAADLGIETTLVERRANPGGVCLYEGCIPSKALLHAAAVIHEAKHAESFGLSFGAPKIDVDRLRAWKNEVVEKLTGGLGGLAKSRKVRHLRGEARFKDASTLLVKSDAGESELQFDHAIIATGSQPVRFGHFPQSDRIMDSTGALELRDIPKRLLVLGGGYIGLEMSSVYAALGSEVVVCEMADQLLPGTDQDLVRPLHDRLKTQLSQILLGTKVAEIKVDGQKLQVRFEGLNVEQPTQSFDRILVSAGRKPVTDGLGLENTAVRVTERGFIHTDEQCRTTERAIFAIGDVAGQPMLAHKASHEGRVAVEVIHGGKSVFEPLAIPAVVFTDPEIAYTGLTENRARELDRKVEVVRFPWAASGRALTLGKIDGCFTKLLVDPDDGRILGGALVGPGAGEMIAEITLAIEMGANAEDLALTIHPHPTLSETIMESAEVFLGHSTHIFRPRKAPSPAKSGA